MEDGTLTSSQQRRKPFLTKEGGIIQVDINGHPAIPTGSKQTYGNSLFLAGVWFLNFRGHFEGLNEVFWDKSPQ
jgi:hypothetical protein